MAAAITATAASLARLPAGRTGRAQAALRPYPSLSAGRSQGRRALLPVLAYRVEPEAPPAAEAPFTGPPLPAVQAPTIDAQGFLALERAAEPLPEEVARQISEAGSTAGCFQLVNHGVSLELIERMKAAQRAFFALPLEEKLKIKRSAANPNGFFNDEYTKQILDLKEGFDFVHEIDSGDEGTEMLAARNQWPSSQPEFREAMEAYLAEMSRVSFRLLEAFSIGMGLPATTLHHLFGDDHTSFMRLNHYPATKPHTPGMALNHHTDAGFLTILIQDPEVHGLQFHKRGQWNDVTPAPDALTINVGDQCQVLTNDVFKAPVHRVLSPKNGKARYSAPFFLNPRPGAVIEPLKEFVSEEQPAIYHPIPWAVFRQQRYSGDLADQGREIQIYHYKR